MSRTNRREQVLANCKCLYGAGTEVFTLSHGSHGAIYYQAVAMKFDPFMATWAKVLHSKAEVKSRNEAMLSLLRETEIELAKLLSANGLSIPISGDSVQTVSLHRRGRSHSGASGSDQSETSTFEFIPTPISTSPEEGVFEEITQEETKPLDPDGGCVYASHENLNPEPQIEKLTCHDEAPSTPNEERQAEGTSAPEPEPAQIDNFCCGSFSTKKSKKKKGNNFFENVPEVHDPTVLDIQKETPAEDFDDWGSFTKKDKKKSKAVAEEVVMSQDVAVPEPEVEVVDDWANWGVAPLKKKKKGKTLSGETMRKDLLADGQTSKPVEEPSEPSCEPSSLGQTEPEPYNSGWDFWGSTKVKKSKRRVTFEQDPVLEACAVETFLEEPKAEEPASPELESNAHQTETFDWDTWGMSAEEIKERREKREKAKATSETHTMEIPPPVAESTPPVDEDFGWGSFGTSKKSKKSKKTKSRVIIEESPVDEVLAPVTGLEENNVEATPPPVKGFGWGSWGSPKGKGEEITAVLEEVPTEVAPAPDETPQPAIGEAIMVANPEPEPGTEMPVDDPWDFTSKKEKKKKKKPLFEEPEPEREVLVDDPWSFTTKKVKKNKKSSFEEAPTVDEAIPTSGAMTFESWDIKTTKANDPEPAPEDDSWGSFFLSKKSKKGKQKSLFAPVLELPPPSPEPTIEGPLPGDAQDISVTVTSLSDKTSDATNGPTLKAQIKQTVVLKIIHISKGGEQTLHAMVNILENTRSAVCDAVNSYLDESGEVRYIASSRSIVITHGAGKTGDLDLSSLEDSRWPEYLEYLGQYTKFPELIVRAVDSYAQ